MTTNRIKEKIKKLKMVTLENGSSKNEVLSAQRAINKLEVELKAKTETPTLEEYKKIIETFDWNYHTTDDYDYYEYYDSIYQMFDEINNINEQYYNLFYRIINEQGIKYP